MYQNKPKTITSCLVFLIGTSVVTAYGQSYNQEQGASIASGFRAPIIRYNAPGYYWPHYHSATAMGDYLHGAAAVIEARACWNYYTSQAMINAEQARSNALENDLFRVKNYYEKKALYKQNRDMEQMARQEKPIHARQVNLKIRKQPEIKFDATTGDLNWPTALQRKQFAEDRAFIEKLLAPQNNSMQNTSYSNPKDVVKAVEHMRELLKDSLHFNNDTGESAIPPMDYVAANNFLNTMASFAHESNKNISQNLAAN